MAKTNVPNANSTPPAEGNTSKEKVERKVVPIQDDQFLADPYDTVVPDESGTRAHYEDVEPIKVPKNDDEAAKVRAARRRDDSQK